MKHIYLVLSATPFKIGTFVRYITKSEYNHASISLEDSLTPMYAFARHHKTAPFYGGLVVESGLRYEYHNRSTKIKVYKIPVSDKSHKRAHDFIEDTQRSHPVYNLISACFVPARHRVLIRDSYTCVEFASEVLARADVCDMKSGDFYNFDDFKKVFSPFVIYEGDYKGFIESTFNPDDRFLDKLGFFKSISKMAGVIFTLIKRKFP